MNSYLKNKYTQIKRREKIKIMIHKNNKNVFIL